MVGLITVSLNPVGRVVILDSGFGRVALVEHFSIRDLNPAPGAQAHPDLRISTYRTGFRLYMGLCGPSSVISAGARPVRSSAALQQCRCYLVVRLVCVSPPPVQGCLAWRDGETALNWQTYKANNSYCLRLIVLWWLKSNLQSAGGACVVRLMR